MLDKLEQIEARYEALTEELSQPEVYSDPANYAKLNKQHRSLGEMVKKYREWKQLKAELAGAKELLDLCGRRGDARDGARRDDDVGGAP